MSPVDEDEIALGFWMYSLEQFLTRDPWKIRIEMLIMRSYYRLMNTLASGCILKAGQYLVSANGKYFLYMQSDSNLCLYEGSGPADNRGVKWDIETGGRPSDQYFLSMQIDGNLVVYKGTDPSCVREVVWHTRTNQATGQFFLAVQDDGNLVVYRQGNPVRIVWDKFTDDPIRLSLKWVFSQGPPTRNGAQGRGFLLFDKFASNPWDHPDAHTGDCVTEMDPRGAWRIRIFRGDATGADCIRFALVEHDAGNLDYALAWLCAGQAHNGNEQTLYKQNPDFTWQIAKRYYGWRFGC